ncbi:Probable RNA-directed DNA polymerase from transposon BS [Eumeta japonica]|uniref:Probable RNA-directed DNA polymerase from transposon BS n=1 Tax=Eumeta variegata TaxID=151549 RepID=A0A4C1WM00_EUMVA|nr:Probable RNA-directed DNA polymerase from transposon BS [Eumeta japonica]
MRVTRINYLALATSRQANGWAGMGECLRVHSPQEVTTDAGAGGKYARDAMKICLRAHRSWTSGSSVDEILTSPRTDYTSGLSRRVNFLAGDQSEAENRGGRYGTAPNRCYDRHMRSEQLPLPGDLFITSATVHKIVMRLPKKKAPGPDSISTATLRHLPKRATVAMNRVFNGILRTDHFPEE